MVGPHLFTGVQVGFAVQAAYPPALKGFVVGRLGLGLHTLVGVAVAGLQVGPVVRRQVLGLGSDHLGWLHVLVGLELRAVGGEIWR